MDENDFKRIEVLFNRQTEQFQNYIGVVEENFQQKLDLVVEGQQMLAEKLEMTRHELKSDINSLDKRLISVEAKLDTVAADLAAHRADTEAHHGVYRVKES
jgi:septal ring factor EnvC (AmiA/AmiB activator)